jgi:hypothetical protein
VQLSVLNRTSTLNFSPEPTGDLLFNGISQEASRMDVAPACRATEAGGSTRSWRINDRHTLRAGFLVQIEHATSATTDARTDLAFVREFLYRVEPQPVIHRQVWARCATRPGHRHHTGRRLFWLLMMLSGWMDVCSAAAFTGSTLDAISFGSR